MSSKDPVYLERRKAVLRELVSAAKGDIPPEILKDVHDMAMESLNLFLSSLILTIGTYLLDKLERSTETGRQEGDR